MCLSFLFVTFYFFWSMKTLLIIRHPNIRKVYCRLYLQPKSSLLKNIFHIFHDFARKALPSCQLVPNFAQSLSGVWENIWPSFFFFSFLQECLLARYATFLTATNRKLALYKLCIFGLLSLLIFLIRVNRFYLQVLYRLDSQPRRSMKK